MDEINWNEAPEGYDYWITDNHSLDSDFHKKEGDLYIDQDGRSWHVIQSSEFTLIPRPESSQIPPVGTVCEYSSLDGTKYYKCEILGRNKELVWIRTTECDKHHIKKESDFKFRPVQTEEELAVEEIMTVIENCPPLERLDFDRRVIAKTLYKAGYRKENI